MSWAGDAASLVEAFRAKELSPSEALDDCLTAIERSELNAFSFVDADSARRGAAGADVSLPFGGVPVGIKELDRVGGWPDTHASLALADRVAGADSTHVARLRAAGAVPVGLTAAPEFGVALHTSNRLNGVTRNPWDQARTPGGSSGGSAAAVAGGLVPIASGTDGGGSIRVPAGWCGLVGLKPTHGRIPKGPNTTVGSLNSVSGCLSRSVRDTARWLDATNGYDHRDPFSLPRVVGYEAGLGTRDVARLRVAVAPTLGMATVHSDSAARAEECAGLLARVAGVRLVDVDVRLPENSMEWMLGLRFEVLATLGDRYPACVGELTDACQLLLQISTSVYNLRYRGLIEQQRMAMNEAMADAFEQADVVVCPTSPDLPFDAEGPSPQVEIEGETVRPLNLAALTMPSNIHGNPAISVPGGQRDGLPVGVQLLAPHHREDVLLELALVLEREQPWPLVRPGGPW